MDRNETVSYVEVLFLKAGASIETEELKEKVENLQNTLKDLTKTNQNYLSEIGELKKHLEEEVN